MTISRYNEAMMVSQY